MNFVEMVDYPTQQCVKAEGQFAQAELNNPNGLAPSTKILDGKVGDLPFDVGVQVMLAASC